MRLRATTLATLVCALGLCALGEAADWPQFRGPNSAGISPSTNIPASFDPAAARWKTALPAGHSSPIVVGKHIFLPAFDGPKLFLIALDRASGRELWRRDIPRPRTQELHKTNSPASPTPTSDGQNVYAFFVDFGLISFTHDGRERWRLPLGPFNNPFGQAASPVLSGSTLLQPCDAESGSFFLAVNKDTGKVKWRVERPEYTRGFSTPILYKPANGPAQVLLAGSYQLTAYQVETGEVVWYSRGLTWQLKPTPVMDAENIYVLGWAGEADPGQQEVIPTFRETLDKLDANKDGKLSKEELAATYPKIPKEWVSYDLDVDGYLGERDWKLYQSKRSVVNGIRAIKLGGSGDMTHNIKWTYSKSLPNVPSPLLYNGVLYMVKDSGILTTLDPKTGEVHKQGRLPGLQEPFYSSPIAADGKVFVMSEGCKLATLKAGPEWEVLAVSDFDDICHATPAIVDNTVYIRTRGALYAFGPEKTTAQR
ncbi:MAG: PQQ-binding-like beta-propeller repeat protein [Bryobacterales bacterium]|nr:PQQ-binding-like beta-propeller repeat protein [Bryobacterales bacterium]